MSPLAQRVAQVRAKLAEAARRAGRAPDEVRLLAVSKGFPAERVSEAARCGLECFGENRVQEAQEKIPRLREEGLALSWHLIGSLQRNKARRAAELFDVIHSLDRPVLAAELASGATARRRPLRVLIQVNIDDEPQKAGVAPSGLAELVKCTDALPELRLEGLMTIPRACTDPEEVRPSFARLRALLEQINAGRPEPRRLRELSMGMSADYEVAIQEGATWVRIGTAIFGEREKPGDKR